MTGVVWPLARWRSVQRRERRRMVAVLLACAVAVGAWLGLRWAWTRYTEAAVRHELLAGAANLQHVALVVRSGDPAATGPDAERALAAALRGVARVRVLGTSTGPDGHVRADVSLWAAPDTAEFSFDNPKEAEVCLHVIALPGSANGGYGGRGSVAVETFDCPPGVALAPTPWGSRAPSSLPEVSVELAAKDVPPVYKPCYSGSDTCN